MARRKRKKDSSKKYALMGIFIVAIMVLSGVGYMWSGSANTPGNYDGHKLIMQNNRWYAETGEDTYVSFSYHPSELESMNMSSSLTQYLKNVRMLYMTFDPESELVQEFEIQRLRLERVMPEHLSIYPSTGVTKNTSQYSAYPVIGCENSTVHVPVLYFREGNTTEIIAQDTCIILQARNGFEIDIVTDRLLYGLLGIIG